MPDEDVAFVVNPASANGSTRQALARDRTPGGRARAHRARRSSASGRARSPSSPGGRPRTAPGSSSPSAATARSTRRSTGSCSSSPSKRAELASLPRGTGKDFVRTFGIPRNVDGALAVGPRRRGARRRRRARVASRPGTARRPSPTSRTSRAPASAAPSPRGANTSSKALGGRRLVLLGDQRRLRALAELRVHGRGRRRAPRREDARGHRGDRRATRPAGCGSPRRPTRRTGSSTSLLIGDVTKLDFVRTLPKIYRGTYLPHPRAELVRGKRVRGRVRDPAARSPSTASSRERRPQTFEIVPGALRVRVPGSA